MVFNKLFRFPKNEVLGLDIGTSAVKMVALRKDYDSEQGYVVEAAAVAEIAKSEDGNQQKTHASHSRRTNIIRAIHDCIKSAGIRRKLAVCGVSGPEVAVRDFEFPRLEDEEISGAVRLEAAQVCPFNTDDPATCGIDYQLIDLSQVSNGHELQMNNGLDADIENNKTKGILVAATNKLINDKVQFAKEAHLKCVLMDVDGLALLNCFNKLADENEISQAGGTTAILNAGASNMTIAIMGSNEALRSPFIRDMAYAGNDIIEHIAAENDLPSRSVKELLFGSSQTDEVEIQSSLEKACRKVIDNVAETLRFYSVQVKLGTVKRIFVCGGFASAKGFVELLSNNLGIEAVIWNPFEKIRCEKDRQYQDLFKEKGSALAVAAGLAMRSI